MADAGLAEPRTPFKGKGRDSRRAFNEISFHALRHTATSLMKNAGVSPAIVADIIGHDSPAIPRITRTSRTQANAAPLIYCRT